MDDKRSKNRVPWPFYSQSFYYSFALVSNDFPTYHFIFILVKVLYRKLYVGKSLLSRANE